MSAPNPADGQLQFCEGPMPLLVGERTPGQHTSFWRVYSDRRDEVRVTYNGRPWPEEIQTLEGRGLRFGRAMLRLALSGPTTEGNATAELVDLAMGRYLYLTTVNSVETTLHWWVPLGQLTEFLDRADSEMPDRQAE